MSNKEILNKQQQLLNEVDFLAEKFTQNERKAQASSNKHIQE